MDEMHFEKSYLENVECINGDCYSYSVENACPSLINHAKNRLQDKSVQCGLVKYNYHHYPHVMRTLLLMMMLSLRTMMIVMTTKLNMIHHIWIHYLIILLIQ